VNQTYVIATSTKVDMSGVNVEKFDDKYFTREKKKKAKKTEGELFDTEEVYIALYILMQPCSCTILSIQLRSITHGISLYLLGDQEPATYLCNLVLAPYFLCNYVPLLMGFLCIF
jgi:hypothetical protein